MNVHSHNSDVCCLRVIVQDFAQDTQCWLMGVKVAARNRQHRIVTQVLRKAVASSVLADKLKVSKHQLSEYLNTRENQNFTSYLNGFRIAEAKEKLRTEADKSILTVAYEVGFNSKTSFQRVFKQITGVTASEFRETHKN